MLMVEVINAKTEILHTGPTGGSCESLFTLAVKGKDIYFLLPYSWCCQINHGILDEEIWRTGI